MVMDSRNIRHWARSEYIPVGILTRNRPALLDLTLRSLSASTLPHGVKVTVYDDASDLLSATRYLYTSETISGLSNCIPINLANHIPNITTNGDLQGIHGRVKVVRMGSYLGVLHGSLRALCALAQAFEAAYVCLLQDDLVFARNWYDIMCKMAALHRPAILAGITFGSAASPPCERREYTAIKSEFVQAQCLFVARDFLECVLPALSRVDNSQKRGFDTFLCEAAIENGFDILVTYPHVCQHIGIDSLVRPERNFDRKGGRYSRSIQESVVVAEKVRWLCREDDTGGTAECNLRQVSRY